MSVEHETLAPISMIPNEVLSIIFEAACLQSSPGPQRSSFEMILSHVSGCWRSVALNTPQLWTNIHIDSQDSWQVQMTEVYLSRSGALPLAIHLVIDNLDLEVAPAYHNLMTHLPRWSRLWLHCHWQIDLDRFLEPIETSAAPCLQLIDIFLGSMPNPDMIDRRIFGGGAPFLTYVRLRNLALRSCLPPLQSVTNLRLDEPNQALYTSPSQLASMLNGLPALTHLVLSGYYGEDGAPLALIELPSLRSLHTLIFTDMFPILLNMILAPHMESLLLEEISAWHLDEFANLTSGSPKFPSLKSLTILYKPGQAFTLPTWGNVIRAFPAVRCMTLLSHDPCDFLISLRPQSRPGSQDPVIPWPDLHTLTLISELGLLPFAIGAFCNTVSTRFRAGCPIRKLQLSNGVLAGLTDKLEWLQERAVVESTTLFQNKPKDTYFTDLLDQM
jgi:hypothetical protein